MDIALLNLDFGPHGLEAFDVLIDRPGADGAAARKRNPGLAATGDQGTEDQDRRPHGLDHLVGRQGVVQAGAVKDQFVGSFEGHADTHLAKKAQHGGDIVQVGHVGEPQSLVAEQGGTENRQGRILRPGNGDLARKGDAPLQQKFIHGWRSILPACRS